MQYTFPVYGTYLLNAGSPLDARLCVKKIDNLINTDSFWSVNDSYSHVYNGMIVTCVEDLNIYVYKGRTLNEAGTAFNYDFSLKTGWKLIGSAEDMDLSNYVTKDVLEDTLEQMKTEILVEPSLTVTFSSMPDINTIPWVDNGLIEVDADNVTCKIYGIDTVVDNNSTAVGGDFNASLVTSVIIGDSVTSIGRHAFRYCDSLISVVIPNSVTSIGECAFCGCSSLTSVTIPDSVTSIGAEAFYECDSLTSVVIPDSVITIDSSAFLSCDNLTSVVIGESVTSIGTSAFLSDNLTSITFKNPTPFALHPGGIIPDPDSGNLSQIIVPKEAIQTYKKGWLLYADIIVSETPAIQEWVEDNYITKTAFNYADGVLTINLD